MIFWDILLPGYDIWSFPYLFNKKWSKNGVLIVKASDLDPIRPEFTEIFLSGSDSSGKSRAINLHKTRIRQNYRICGSVIHTLPKSLLIRRDIRRRSDL